MLFVPALIWSFLTDRMDMAVAQSFAWLYYLEALCATLGFLQLARTIKIKWVVSLFNYIGSKTLYILTFHILAFKIVTFAWIKLHEMPIEKLSTIYPLKGVNPWLWIVYVFVGIAVSLAIWEIKETILRRFKRSINK